MEYKQFSPEQIERATNSDIIDFLNSYMGFEFKQSGHYYQCRQHNSLVVYADRKGFVWNSRNISGGGTIDFLRKVEGKTFPEAVGTILNESVSVSSAPQFYKPESGKLILPEKADGKYDRVFAYLSKTRGISPEIISDFMRSKQIYQDKKGNCVFVGFDENGEARFATVRGTLSEKKYRGDCKNSDKRYPFCQIGHRLSELYVFEAPIDLLSHCVITNEYFKNPEAYKYQSRLALCGSSDVALDAFLKRHEGKVKTLNFRLDNDEAGRAAAVKFKSKYIALGYKCQAVFSKNKDINEDLIERQERINKQIKR